MVFKRVWCPLTFVRSGETLPGRLLSPETKQVTRSMASSVEYARDPPSKTFGAGSYVFTRAQAQQLARLHQLDKVSVWRLREEFHSLASLKQVIVAIQVGIMLQDDGLNLDDLHPAIFKPKFVYLWMWNVGKPTERNE